MSAADELYVGYLDHAPPGIARRTRALVALLLLAALGVALAVQAGTPRAADKVFEFGSLRPFEGVVAERPYPALLVERPGDAGRLPGASRYLLVAEGKRGAAALVAGLDGRRVRLTGSLVHRAEGTLIEVAAGSVEPLPDGAPPPQVPPSEDLGTLTLRGEIVDSKCWTGVMTPGATRTHRACAIRCISGGIPPVLLVRDAGGHAVYLLLVGEDGRTVNEEVLPLVAEPIEVTGRVRRQGDLLVLEAEPATYRRVH